MRADSISAQEKKYEIWRKAGCPTFAAVFAAKVGEQDAPTPSPL